MGNDEISSQYESLSQAYFALACRCRTLAKMAAAGDVESLSKMSERIGSLVDAYEAHSERCYKLHEQFQER